jgi:alkylation response protein AidB-like acyl-CoA dehydrogenase
MTATTSVRLWVVEFGIPATGGSRRPSRTSTVSRRGARRAGADRVQRSSAAAMCKWWLTEVQCQVVDKCLQLFGGYGYMREHGIAKLYVDARAQKIYGGANEIQKELIARSL